MLELLDHELIIRILDEAFQLLIRQGVRVSDGEARQLLISAGARVENGAARMTEKLVREQLAKAPHKFALHDRAGNPAVKYTPGDVSQFDPGSCSVNVLDSKTKKHCPARSDDLARIVRVTEMLPEFAAQSTAVVCNDAPETIGDLYRLYIVLLNSNKPVVTGAFSARNLPAMIALLATDAGSKENLRRTPRAVFDVCPSPPLHWTEFACRCLIELGRAGVPAEMVSMPLAGATAPVTLAGSLVQHTAESLAGIVIHQLTAPGAPIVWGGAPAIFDMRSGTTPMGAMETAMLNAGLAQIGKHFGLPTHGYLGASDSKLLDAQAGMESGMTALTGALAGINMISGAGMLDFLNCFSVEKLVLDAEAVGMAKRLKAGVSSPTGSLALDQFATLGFSGDFLKLKETRAFFQKEQRMPSSAIDRGSLRAWQDAGELDAFERAHAREEALLSAWQPPQISTSLQFEFKKIVEQAAGVTLPPLP